MLSAVLSVGLGVGLGVVLGVVSGVVSGIVLPGAAAEIRGSGAACLLAPTDAAVVDPFREPPCPWCPGNRGLEYGTAPGDPLRAMSDGVVTFAGVVAGTLYVTVAHDPAPLRRSTYGGLARSLVAPGDRVTAGQIVARAAGPTLVTVRSPGPGGVEVYVDPAPLLGRPSWRPRLVPRDGTPARAAAPGPPTCR